MSEKSNVYKGGRCWNGSHKDAGTIIHIIEGVEPNGYWGGKALCGTETGKRSYGWAKSDSEATCKRCINKKLNH